MVTAWVVLILWKNSRKLSTPNWQNQNNSEGHNEKICGCGRQYWRWEIYARGDALRAHGLGAVLRAGGRESLSRRFLRRHGYLVVPFPDLLPGTPPALTL